MVTGVSQTGGTATVRSPEFPPLSQRQGQGFLGPSKATAQDLGKEVDTFWQEGRERELGRSARASPRIVGCVFSLWWMSNWVSLSRP